MNIMNLPIWDSQWLTTMDNPRDSASFSPTKRNRSLRSRKRVPVESLNNSNFFVGIYSKNHYATMGIRFCLEKYSGLRLGMHNNPRVAFHQMCLHQGYLVIINPNDDDFTCILKLIIENEEKIVRGNVIVISERHTRFMQKLSEETGFFQFLPMSIDLSLMVSIIDELFLLRKNRIQNTYQVLNVREREIIKMLAENKTVRQIACRLGINIKTVYYHKSVTMKKFNVESKMEETWLLSLVKMGVFNLF